MVRSHQGLSLTSEFSVPKAELAEHMLSSTRSERLLMEQFCQNKQLWSNDDLLIILLVQNYLLSASQNYACLKLLKLSRLIELWSGCLFS